MRDRNSLIVDLADARGLLMPTGNLLIDVSAWLGPWDMLRIDRSRHRTCLLH